MWVLLLDTPSSYLVNCPQCGDNTHTDFHPYAYTSKSSATDLTAYVKCNCCKVCYGVHTGVYWNESYHNPCGLEISYEEAEKYCQARDWKIEEKGSPQSQKRYFLFAITDIQATDMEEISRGQLAVPNNSTFDWRQNPHQRCCTECGRLTAVNGWDG